MSGNNNVYELCSTIGIPKSKTGLINYMYETKKAPFRMDDITAICDAAGIRVTASMKKQELVTVFVNALNGNRGAFEAMNALICGTKYAEANKALSRAAAAPPAPTPRKVAAAEPKKGTATAATAANIDAQIDTLRMQLNHLQLQKAKLR